MAGVPPAAPAFMVTPHFDQGCPARREYIAALVRSNCVCRSPARRWSTTGGYRKVAEENGGAKGARSRRRYRCRLRFLCCGVALCSEEQLCAALQAYVLVGRSDQRTLRGIRSLSDQR